MRINTITEMSMAEGQPIYAIDVYRVFGGETYRD